MSRHFATAVTRPFYKSGPFSGRFSNTGLTVTVFGAYGFLGRYIMEELAHVGARVYVPFRGCEMEVRHLKPAFDLGQIGFMPFSPRDENSVRDALKNSDVVINLIGKHYETKHIVPTRRSDGSLSRINYSFDEVHASIPRTIARLANECGVEHLIHVSSLAAKPDSVSRWSSSKAAGEAAVREEFPNAIIVKPATVFGHEDKFLNMIAETAVRLPFSPLVNEGRTRLQPIHAVDVGRALITLVNNARTLTGSTVQLAGPAEYSYKEVVEFVLDMTTIDSELRDVPVPLAKLASGLVETFIPNPIIAADTISYMLEDNVPVKESKVLSISDLGIEPSSMDKVAFDYLHRFRPGGHFKTVKGYYSTPH